MCYRAGNHAAVFQLVQVLLPAGPLRRRAGKQINDLATFILRRTLDHKTGRPPHAGQHSDLFDCLTGGSVQTFFKRHIRMVPAQLKAQAAVGIKGKGCALQHLPGGNAMIQLFPPQVGSVAAKSFSTVFKHLFSSFLIYKIKEQRS